MYKFFKMNKVDNHKIMRARGCAPIFEFCNHQAVLLELNGVCKFQIGGVQRPREQTDGSKTRVFALSRNDAQFRVMAQVGAGRF